MGHADFKTTQIYSDYAPADNETALVDAAFAPDPAVRSADHLMDQTERN
jgi:hypothetical protein